MKQKLVRNLLFILIFYVSCSPKDPELTIKIFEAENGWGYSIFEQEKLVIRQQYIPVINNKTSFKTQKDALIVGTIVLEKLKHHKSPSISAEELKNSISLYRNN